MPCAAAGAAPARSGGERPTYFFDVGVANTLKRTGPILGGSEAYDRALEHQVFLELRAFLDYRRLDLGLAYWRSLSARLLAILKVDPVLDPLSDAPRMQALLRRLKLPG